MKCNITLFFLFIFGMVNGHLQGQSVKEKFFEKEYNNLDQIEISHRNGPMNVHQSLDGKIKVKAQISAKGSEPDIDIFLSKIEIKPILEANSLNLTTELNTQRWVNNNGKIKITFKDGSKVKNITEFKIAYDVYLPEMELIKLKNRYHNIHLESLKGNVEIETYDSDIYGEDVEGSLKIINKYGEVHFQNVETLDLTLYESKAEIEEASSIKLDQKYSKIKIGTCTGLTAKSYDGKLEVKLVNGDVELEDKYSEISIGSFQDGIITMYDGEFKTDKGNDILLASKYTEFEFGTLTNLNISANYEDKFKIKSIGVLASLQSKYSTFMIDQLNTSINLVSYEDKLDVLLFGNDLQKIEIESKYLKTNLPLGKFSGVSIHATGKYNKLSYAEAGFEVVKHIEKSSELDFKGKKGNGKIEVILAGYESTFNLK